MRTSRSLKDRLAELLTDRSYRELAARLGVSHPLLWKAATGASIRPRSRRLIEEALDRLAGVEMEKSLHLIQRRLAQEVGEKAAARSMGVIREAISAAYESKR